MDWSTRERILDIIANIIGYGVVVTFLLFVLGFSWWIVP